jgi:hypothetical protein
MPPSHITWYHIMNITISCECIIAKASAHKCHLTLNKNDDPPYHHHYISDNLVAIDHSKGRYPIIYVLEAHIELHPFVPLVIVLLWSIAWHGFVSLFSWWLCHVCHSIGEFFIAYSWNLISLRLNMIALSMKKPHCKTRKPSHDSLASCALLFVWETQPHVHLWLVDKFSRL